MQEQEEYIILRDDDDDDEVVAPPPKAETEATPEDEAKTEPSADETKTAVKPDKTKATHEAKSDAPPPKCNAWCAVGRRARRLKVHAYLIHHLRNQMPRLFGRDDAQARLLDDLPRRSARKSTAGSGRPDRTRARARPAASTSIRPVFGRIESSRRALEARRTRPVPIVR